MKPRWRFGKMARDRAAEALETGRRRRYIPVMRLLAAFLTILLLTGGLTPASTAQTSAPMATFSRDTLVIESRDKSHKFVVEVALTHRQQMQGLMFRRRMAPDAGMLFVYKRDEPTAMWMKNTYLPLDMLFIGADGRIVKIAERTVPLSLATISSGGPVVGVLELNAGTTSRLGIKPGDRVLAAALGTAR